MKQNLIFKYFIEICKLPFVKDAKQELRDYVKNKLSSYEYEINEDKSGNLYVLKANQLNKVKICLQTSLHIIDTKWIHSPTFNSINFIKENNWIKIKQKGILIANIIRIALILAILADQTFPNYPIKVIFCNDAHSLVYKEWIKDVSLFILNDNDHRLVVSKDANDESIEINSILDTYHLLKQVISDNYNN